MSEGRWQELFNIVCLPGDGIGPEVTGEAVKVLAAAAERFGLALRFHWDTIGGAAIEASGDPLPPDTLARCQGADAVLLGAVGGPQWDSLPPGRRPEQGLLRLRQGLAVFANLRPVKVDRTLAACSPLRPEIIGEGVDMLIVRELIGGLYYGPKRTTSIADDEWEATDTMTYTTSGIRQVAEVAFRLARERRGLVTSVDKANVLECSRLWRREVSALAAKYPDVKAEHQYVDSCAMQLVAAPRRFDVILTENTFGDILSDLASVFPGSLGMLPSASIGAGPGLYEPVHGSAPDIAGRGIANPIGAILSGAMLLRYSLGVPEAAQAVEDAVAAVLAQGHRTADLRRGAGQATTTVHMGDLIAAAVRPVPCS